MLKHYSLTPAFLLTLLIATYLTAAPQVRHIDLAQRHEYQQNNYFDPGQLLLGHVSVAEATGRHTVALIWRDAYGRIAGADTVQVASPVAAADFSILLDKPLSFVNRVEAFLDGVPQPGTADFRIRPAKQPWDDYYTMVWAGYQYEYLDSLRAAGINTHMVYKDFPYFDQLIAADFETYVDNINWRVFAPYHKWRPRWNAIKKQVAANPYNTSLLVRIPSFEDPATEEAIKTTVQQIVNFHKPHRPIFFNLADEMGVGDQSGPIDFDHSVFAREAFIQYLREKYGTIEELNHQWDTNLASFYQAARGTLTLTDAAMDRIWRKELAGQFGSSSACARHFGVKLASIEDYVSLNASLKSTPSKTVEQVEKMLPGLKKQFNLDKLSAKQLAQFADKFHQWTTTLSIANPSGLNLSPWMDHKDFMDRSIAGAMGKAYRYAREADPEGVFGFTGGHSPNAFAGYNLEYLSRVADLQVPYNLAADVEIIRSLNKKTILVTPTWDNDSRGIRRLWYHFFHNDHGVIFWDNDEPRNKLVEKKDGTLTQRAKVFQPLLEELTGGLGKLILNCERQHDRIAVLYSHPSIRVHWLMQHLGLGKEWILRESWHEYKELNFNRLRMALLYLIEDHFLQYDFISYVQLAEGLLEGGEYDLLFLPQSIVLSDDEAAAIDRFVEGGGTVVADSRCGLMDGSGKARHAGALDEIFGIHSEKGSAGEINSVSTAGAKKVVLGDIPVYLNSHGLGKAVYLDRSISEYYFQRQTPGKDTELFELFGAIFDTAGIERPAKISGADGSRLPGTELVRYLNGDQEILSLFRNTQVRIIGIGGTEKVDNTAFEKEENIRLSLPRPSHVYDLRNGNYLGFKSDFTLKLDPWNPTMLSLNRKRLSSITVVPSSKSCTPGCPILFKINLSSPEPSSSSGSLNVVSVRVFSPENRRLRHYDSRIVFQGDSSLFELPLAVNDIKGEYLVTFSHVSTGLSSSVRIQAID
jgi:hypothetical protein